MPSSLSPTSVSGFLRFRVGFLVVHCARRFLAPHTFSKADESQASATLGSDSGSVSVVDSSATSYPAGTTWSTREPKTDQEPRPAAAIRSCRLCFGSNVHHPCKLRRLATKRSATMRGVDPGSGQLWLCRGSSQSACCMVSGTSCFRAHVHST